MARLHDGIDRGAPLKEGDLIVRHKPGGPNRNSSIVGFLARIHHVVSTVTFISENGDKLFLDDFRRATESERYEYERAKPRPRFVKELRRAMDGLISRDDLSKRTPHGTPVVDTGTVIVRMRQGKAGRRYIDNIGYITRIVRIHQNGDFSDENNNDAHIGSFRLADGSETHKFIQAGGRVSNVNSLKDIDEMNYLSETRGGYNGRSSSGVTNFAAQAAHSDRELAAMMAMKARMMDDEVERASLLRQAGIPQKRSMHQRPIAMDVMPMKVKAEKKIERTLPPPVVIPIGKKKIKRLI